MPETSLSLLERLRDRSDTEAWQRFFDLYCRLIQSWLDRLAVQAADQDDLVQEVLTFVVRNLPEFHRGRPGAFRAWLRAITVNRLREFWRSRDRRAMAVGGSDFAQTLDQLEDPQSALSRQWDEEHDRHVVRRLLEMVEPQFEPTTLEAFRLLTIEGRKASEVASRLGISVNAVLLAKSRVLRRLRRELDGFLD